MISRRSLTLLLLALALIAPAAALAEKAPPKRAVPKLLLTLTDGAVNTKTVNPVIQTTFLPPKGTTAAKACRGRVTVSAPIGTKKVKKKKKKIYATKKSQVRAAEGICTANSMLALPASFYGKTVKFTVKYPGNDAVKKFSKSSKLVVSVVKPVPLPTPALFDLVKGPWTATQTGVSGAPMQWPFTIGADNTVAQMGPRYGNIEVACPHHDGVTIGFSPQNPLGIFDTPFTISANEQAVTDDNFVDPERTKLEFKLKFDSPTHGTATFQLTGTLYASNTTAAVNDLVAGCASDVITVELRQGAAI